MSEDDAGVSRRAFLRTAAAGTVAAGAASGNAAGQEQPQFGSWLQGVDGGYEDLRGSSEVTVQVGADGNGGAYAFSPAGIWVDSGTTVTFEWTGEGGGHNVVGDSGPASDSLNSGDPVAEAGTTYEYTFEEGGITNYYCDPHLSLGMKGAVAVGGDVATTGGGGGGSSIPQVPESAKVLGVASSIGLLSTLGLAYFFLKYGGDYDEGYANE